MSETGLILTGGDAPILIVGDHASNHVPSDIALGIDPLLLDEHVALDIGVMDVAALLVERLQCRAILGGVSRLVLDLNREEDAPGLVPVESDGFPIPGNVGADVAARIARFHAPYHARVAAEIDAMDAPFILSLHSFTPRLASAPAQQRPWEIGVLYNRDDRAPRIAIPLLEAAGLIVGDQLPYAGTQLNYTMNRHVEARGIPYLGVEMRQDIARTGVGQARFAAILADVVAHCRRALA